MSTLSVLSNHELDAVTGGFLNFAILTGSNGNIQLSGQNNQAAAVGFAFQGGTQNQNNVQNTGNFSGGVSQS